MSFTSCSAPKEASSYCCCWNCDRGFKCDSAVAANVPTRRKREFTPDEQKDEHYWLKRSRNNEAAKRSRDRRRMEERLMEARTAQLIRENQKLKAALSLLPQRGVGHTVVDYPPVRDLSRDYYLRSLFDFPALSPLSGTLKNSSYTIPSRCSYTSAYDSVSLSEMDTVSAVSYPDNTLASTKFVGSPLGILTLAEGNVSGYAPQAMTVFHSPNEVVPNEGRYVSRSYGIDYPGPHGGQGFQGHCLKKFSNSKDCNSIESKETACASNDLRLPGTRAGCVSDIVLNEPYLNESPVIKAKGITDETKSTLKGGHGSASPLLPHKLRYKVNKGKLNTEHVFLTSP